MDNTFWNAKYAGEEYIYGTLPNAFMAAQISQIKPGKALVPADGEGRNGVFLATQSWKVTAFDISEVARDKALQLAKKHNVSVDYQLTGYDNFDAEDESFDMLVLCFAHMPPHRRREWHRKLVSYLRPGGHLILQGFHKDQLRFQSGGPKNIDMLFSAEELREDFEGLSSCSIKEHQNVLDEGAHHHGMAALVSVYGIK